MTDAQVIDLVKTAVSTILGGGLVLLSVRLTSRSDAKKRQKEVLRERGEELYTLNEKWLNRLTGYYLRRSYVMQGKLTYNQALDLEIAEGTRNHSSDFGRVEMLIHVYFPAALPAYNRVTAGRETLNEIATEHERAYKMGDLDGRRYLKTFHQAMEDIGAAGESLKAAILSALRSI